MRQTTGTRKSPGEKLVKDIKRATRKQYSSEEKIRIVLDGLRGEDSIAELCRREGISQGIYYKWSKDFMEAGKKRLAGDTARAANTDEVKDLRREARDLNGLRRIRKGPGGAFFRRRWQNKPSNSVFSKKHARPLSSILSY